VDLVRVGGLAPYTQPGVSFPPPSRPQPAVVPSARSTRGDIARRCGRHRGLQNDPDRGSRRIVPNSPAAHVAWAPGSEGIRGPASAYWRDTHCLSETPPGEPAGLKRPSGLAGSLTHPKRWWVVGSANVSEIGLVTKFSGRRQCRPSAWMPKKWPSGPRKAVVIAGGHDHGDLQASTFA
jgi:hypothetical protein